MALLARVLHRAIACGDPLIWAGRAHTSQELQSDKTEQQHRGHRVKCPRGYEHVAKCEPNLGENLGENLGKQIWDTSTEFEAHRLNVVKSAKMPRMVFAPFIRPVIICGYFLRVGNAQISGPTRGYNAKGVNLLEHTPF
eukprot:7436131-Pyramimonas_sp.AAC.1